MILIVGKGLMGSQLATYLKRNKTDFRHISARNYEKIQDDNIEIVFEMSVEDFEAKRNLLIKLNRDYPEAILATGTSSLLISELSKHLAHEGLFIGIHFMNPISRIRYVELIPHSSTLTKVIDDSRSFLEARGFVVKNVADTPGFLVNALLFSFINRAAYYYDDTNELPREIDEMMKNVCNHSIGPLETADLVGLDVCFRILQNLYINEPNRNLPPAKVFENLIAKGELGRKTGKGFYQYN